MAINVQADLRCQNRWRHQDNQAAPPAIGFTPDESMGSDGQWWAHCQDCHDYLEADGFTYDFVYLDPARQRRPNSNQRADIHTAGAYNPLRYDLIDP